MDIAKTITVHLDYGSISVYFRGFRYAYSMAWHYAHTLLVEHNMTMFPKFFFCWFVRMANQGLLI